MSAVVTYYKVIEYNLQAKPVSSRVIGKHALIEDARKQLESIRFTYRFRNPETVGDKMYIKKPHGYVKGWKIEKAYTLDTFAGRNAY